MGMNARILGATGVSGAALLVIVATNTKELVDGVSGIPGLFKAFADIMPAGTGAVVLALAAGIGMWMFAIKWLHRTKDGKPPDFAAETLAIVAAIVVTTGLAWGSDAKTMLVAVALGFIAGNAGPWLAKGVRSLWVAATTEPPRA